MKSTAQTTVLCYGGDTQDLRERENIKLKATVGEFKLS